MAIPSSQVTAVWVKQELDTTEWVSLRDISFRAVKRRWLSQTDGEIWEHVENNLTFVADHLRDSAAECVLDGSIPTFEIDNEPIPYIRLLPSLPSEVLSKLRKVDPFELEDICARLLAGLGATSHVTQRTNDGGIDFVGVSFNIVPAGLSIPSACKGVVIGQAKRYKDGRVISETYLREFVGAATLKKHELNVKSQIPPLAPILYAFWTTSDFDANAKRYARNLGLWYMDGLTLAAYVVHLGLKDIVLALPEVPPKAQRSSASTVIG